MTQYLHMNASGIGSYSSTSGAYSSSGAGLDADAGSMQANTANPFKHNIILVLQAKNIPSRGLLESLLGCLSNQEDKLHALSCGMIPAIFKIYDQCHQSDETVSIRAILLQMLRALILLARGREILIGKGVGNGELRGGLERVLGLLKDQAAEVRIVACRMLEALCSFPDVKSLLHTPDRKALAALVFVFLNDPEPSVAEETLPALQHLTRVDHAFNEETMAKLAEVMLRCRNVLTAKQAQQQQQQQPDADDNDSPPPLAAAVSGNGSDARSALRLLQVSLQVAWNCSLHSAQKEIAIGVGMVDVVAPLLEPERDLETRRCAAGLLASLAIVQSGKLALLMHPATIGQACKLTLDRHAANAGALRTAVRNNCVALLRNFAEAPRGLEAVGVYLLPDPETMLEVLGAAQSAQVLASRIGVRLEAGVQAYDKPVGGTPIHATDVLYSVRALHSLLRSGGVGLTAAWNILDVVERLYERVVFEPPYTSAQAQENAAVQSGGGGGGAAAVSEVVASVRNTASRCLQLLCESNDAARLELMALGARHKALQAAAVAAGGSADSLPRAEIFDIVEGEHLKVQQARQALEAQQREEEEARAKQAAEDAAAAAEAEAAAELQRQQDEEEAARVAAEGGDPAAAAAAAGGEGADEVKKDDAPDTDVDAALAAKPVEA